MQDIYNYVVRDLYLSWSIRINNLFSNSEFVLYLLIGIVLLIVLVLLRKRRMRIILSITSFVIILNIFFIYIPYYKGRVINGYFNNGYQIVSLIESYKVLNGDFPKHLDELSSSLIEKEKLEEMRVGLIYKFYQKDTLRSKKNTELFFEEYYELKLKIPNLNSPLYRFDQHKKKFIIND